MNNPYNEVSLIPTLPNEDGTRNEAIELVAS